MTGVLMYAFLLGALLFGGSRVSGTRNGVFLESIWLSCLHIKFDFEWN